jgi:hypothetical protein
LKDLAVIFLVLVLGVTGCAAPATQLPPTQPPPTQPPVPEVTEEAVVDPLADVVLKMVERLNAGDLEGSLTYFADDSMGYIVGLPPTGMEVYAGKEQIRALWQDSVANHFQWVVNITSTYGGIVYVKAKTWHDFTRQLEVAPLEWIDIYEVRDGKIITYSTTISEEALARLKPALAAVMPPEPTAAPPTDTPVSEINVVISEGTCSYEGALVLKAGPVNVNVEVKDVDKKTYGLTFFTLDADKDIVDLMAATALSYPPSWAKMLTLWEMSTSQTNTLTVKEGPLYLVCWSKPPDLAVGNVGPFEVK